MSPLRSRDDGRALGAFVGDVLVRCPRCGGRAIVVRGRNGGDAIGQQDGNANASPARPAKLTCGHCGLVRAQRLPQSVLSQHRLHADGRDPFFGLPLWLTTATRHGILFAYNAEHLSVLADVVRATLRERHTLSPRMLRNRTMHSRLPRWIKLARNRAVVMRGLARLRQKLASS